MTTICYTSDMEDLITYELEKKLREQDRALAGIKHYLKIAAEYKNDDPEKRLDGIQAALAKAAEYTPRPVKGKRRGS